MAKSASSTSRSSRNTGKASATPLGSTSNTASREAQEAVRLGYVGSTQEYDNAVNAGRSGARYGYSNVGTADIPTYTANTATSRGNAPTKAYSARELDTLAKASPVVVTSSKAKDNLDEIRGFLDTTKAGLASQATRNQTMQQQETTQQQMLSERQAQQDMERQKLDLQRKQADAKIMALQESGQPEGSYRGVAIVPGSQEDVQAQIARIDAGIQAPQAQPVDAQQARQPRGFLQDETEAYQSSMVDRLNTAQSAYDDFRKTITRIQNGTFPLSDSQKALVDSTAAAFDQMTEQARLRGAALSSQTGGFSNKVTQTMGELSNIESQKAMTLANLETGFQDKNYQMVKESYDAFQEFDRQQTEVLTALHRDVVDQANRDREYQMDVQKMEYEQVTKPIQDIAADAARNGATKDVLARILASGSPEEALNAGGQYIGALERQRLALDQAEFSYRRQQDALKASDISSGILTESQIKQVDNSPQGKKLSALASLKTKQDAYKNAVDTYGFEAFGEGKSVVDKAYADFKIAYKEAANLGALTGPDVGLIEEAVKPAAGVMNFGTYITGGGKEGILETIRKADELARKDAITQYRNLNLRNPNYAGSDYVKSFIDPFAVDLPETEEDLNMVEKGEIIRTPDGFYLESLGNGEFKQI